MSSGIAAVWCWYHGGPFRGYQSQPGGGTVQDALEAVLGKGTQAAGRTDLGVHARMQVVTARAPVQSAPLPAGLGIAAIVDAPKKFRPQWSATGKEYRYRLLLADDAAWAPYAWRVDVDATQVEAVLAQAIGTHDFWAFHEKSSPRKARTISQIAIHRAGPRVDVRLTGSGFGRYQVRYLVGGAVGVARGEIRAEDFTAGIQRAVEFAGSKAPAQGLTLWQVHYPFDPFRDARVELPAAPPFVD